MITDFTPRKLGISEIKKAQALLKNDFHRVEIKPWWWMLIKAVQGSYDGYALFDGEEIAAYALFYNDKRTDLSLLDYLAVREAYRANGAGSRFLQALLTLKPNMVLETENPAFAVDDADAELRRRRLGFYHRNGFVETGLLASVFGERYIVLQNGGSDKTLATSTELETLYRGMLGRAGAKKFVMVSEESGGGHGVHLP